MSEQIQTKLIEEEMKANYIDYAMSVIMARALPDARDGLKPVHRRILYTMERAGLFSNKQFRKSAFVVGRTLSDAHPHGDTAVYDALVRMAQDFSLRYPLVQGQGNMGCFSGDTKIKLLDGTSKSFKELCEVYKKDEVFYVYSIDKNGKIVVGEAQNPKLTKIGSELIEITLDTGEKIRCTPDHKFLLKNLNYKKAKDLSSEDSLMPGYFKLSPIRGNTELKDYLMMKDNLLDKYIFVHEISDAFNLRRSFYNISNGPVRHHIDFNKFNNNPENLMRLDWKEHTIIHNNHINELWKKDEFRKKQSEGVKLFYKNNPEHLEKKKEMLRKRNKDPNFIKKISEKRKRVWSNLKLRQDLSDKLKEYFNNHPDKRMERSEFSKKIWSDTIKREVRINNMKEVMKSENVKKKRLEGIKKYILENPEKILVRANKVREFYKKNPEVRKLISERSKKLWLNEDYRSKFINEKYNHSREMAKKAWQNENYRNLQINKAKELWKDENFKNKTIKAVREGNIKRLKEKPNFMKDIAQKAAISHRINWKNSDYKNKIVKNKILYYVNRLIHKVGEESINEENYNRFRTNNCFPGFNNAIKHFNDINDMIALAKEYNHHIIDVKFLDYREDVYDITVNKHHNFLLDCGVFVHNSIDGDAPAAQRYTECRLSKFGEELLYDLDKETVDFIPNYDNTLKEPVVLPSKLPNLLINGSSGIAVGMATNIPPHNINEIIDAINSLIDNKNIEVNELLKVVHGPDFPTGAIISGKQGILEAYKTGRGKIIVKAKTKIEQRKIIVEEIPYQVNKTILIENIADLVREKKIEGISDIRDESDRKGMRLVIELKKDANAEVVLNQLYQHTQLQTTFGIIMLALDENKPKIMNLKELINAFIKHRFNVITRRTKFDLDKAEKRAHILEGLKIALKNIDDVVKLIKQSNNIEKAKQDLISKFILSNEQALAILDMRLQRLTSLEQNKIQQEYNELLKLIKELREILADENKIYEIMKNELLELKQKYGDERKTLIEENGYEILTEDLIQKEDVVVTMTYSGYIKQTPLVEYRQQRRGGKGIIAIETKEEDLVKDLFITSNLNTLLLFTNKGKCFQLKAYGLPLESRYSRGKAIVNLLKLGQDEKVNAVLPINKFGEDYLIFITRKGIIKKTRLNEYENPRSSGLQAIKLLEKDELVNVILSSGNDEVMIGSKFGLASRFNEKDITPVGRNSLGVRGIKLEKDDEVIGMEKVNQNSSLLTITSNGFGKRTKIEEYRLIRRGGKGVTNILTKYLKKDSRNEDVVAIKSVYNDEGIMIITEKGITIRMPANQISVIGRNTQGVRIIKLEDKDKVSSVAKISKE